MSKAIVRKAQFGDEEGIHKAHMRSIRELCSKDYTKEQIEAWGGREYRYEHRKKMIAEHYVWVVEAENQIEGYGLLFLDKRSNILTIGGLYLTPEVVGQGLGQQILNEMKITASKLGFDEVYFNSTKTSKAFYEKHGAVQFKEDSCDTINGVPINCHPMKIEITNE